MKTAAFQEFLRSLPTSLGAVGVQPKSLDDLRAVAHAFEPFNDLDLAQLADFQRAPSSAAPGNTARGRSRPRRRDKHGSQAQRNGSGVERGRRGRSRRDRGSGCREQARPASGTRRDRRCVRRHGEIHRRQEMASQTADQRCGRASGRVIPPTCAANLWSGVVSIRGGEIGYR